MTQDEQGSQGAATRVPLPEGVGELSIALAAAQADLEQPKKSRTAKAGSYEYRYADLADVVAAVLPVLSRHGIAVVQDVRVSDDLVAVTRKSVV